MNTMQLTVLLMIVLITGCGVTEIPYKASAQESESESESELEPVDREARDWARLARSSDVVVVGKVQEIVLVVDEEKLYRKKLVHDENFAPLPDMGRGVKGVLVKLMVETVFVSRTEQRNPIRNVEIYVPNGYFPPMGSKIPQFLIDRRYLVFLSPVESVPEIETLTVIKPPDLGKPGKAFRSDDAFFVVEEASGYVEITSRNEHVLNELRQIIK